MIIKLTYDMARLALKLNLAGSGGQLLDYERVQLIILPRPRELDPCVMGSPIILHGCWPGLPTCVDLANPVIDFKAIVLDGFELDADGRIVFVLDERVWALPPGRYDALLRVRPDAVPEVPELPCAAPPLLPPPLPVPPVAKKPKGGVICPPEYESGFKGCCVPPMPVPPPCPPLPVPPKECILVEFEIDLGPRCTDHVLTEAAVEYTLNTCGAD